MSSRPKPQPGDTFERIYKNGKSNITTKPYIEVERDVIHSENRKIHVLVYGGYSMIKEFPYDIKFKILLNGREQESFVAFDDYEMFRITDFVTEQIYSIHIKTIKMWDAIQEMQNKGEK